MKISHKGKVLDTVKDYEIIQCESCGFIHMNPVPTEEALANIYKEEYYTTEKPQFIERQLEVLMPRKKQNSLKLSLEVQKRFFSLCEEDIDVVVYNDNPFCREIVVHAKSSQNSLLKSIRGMKK